MKIISTLILLLIAFGLNAQNSELDKLPAEISDKKFIAKEVGFMAVFPGCEKHDVNDKKILQECLAKELNTLLGKKLESFGNKMEKQGLISAVAKLQFVIDKSGKIVQVRALTGGNKELGEISEQILNDIGKKTKKIQPATLEDGSPVNLVFQLPIKYVTQNSKINQFTWNEIVIYTLQNSNQKFEIRENRRESKFKVYDVQNDKNLFLGNFKSLNEVLDLEPYNSIYILNSEKNLIAEKLIDKTLYRLYYSKDREGYLESYKVVNGVEELMESFPKESSEFSSLYLKLILR